MGRCGWAGGQYGGTTQTKVNLTQACRQMGHPVERVSQKWLDPSLVIEREDGVLVDVVGGDDCESLKPRHLELLSDGHEGLARHLEDDASIHL